MQKTSKKLNTVFFLIIIVEGYVVLATELLAIRQLIPFVGSGTETVAIIVAAVLLPLAVGYYFGGKYKPKHKGKKFVNYREKLIRNIVKSSAIICLGLSYFFLEFFFPILNQIGISNRVSQTSIYTLLFIVWPVFLLGQTVPLISNYFSKAKLAEITGKMLFFSTLGSFLGSIFSTLVLMSTVGVRNTVIVNIALLVLLIFVAGKKSINDSKVLMLGIFAFTILLNSEQALRTFHIIADNNYSNIAVIPNEQEGATLLSINRSHSSTYSDNKEKRSSYVRYLEKAFIEPSLNNEIPKDILVIGAGGFIFGLDDTLNNYTFVDIDSSIKEIAEEHLLKRKLGPNKQFVAEPGETFVLHEEKKYDIIFLDAFSNRATIPPQLITEEFFRKVKKRLKDNGIVLFNVITSPSFADRFSIKLDNTLKKVFPNMNRQILGTSGDIWKKERNTNVIYMYFNDPDASQDIYTNDKNTYFLDR